MKKILLIIMMAASLSACAQTGQSEEKTEAAHTTAQAREETTETFPGTEIESETAMETETGIKTEEEDADRALTEAEVAESAEEGSGEASESVQGAESTEDSDENTGSGMASGQEPEPAEGSSEGGAARKSGAPDLAAVRDDMISRLGITEYLDVETERLLDLYGIEAGDLVQSGCFVSMSGVFPHEVVMVEAVDADAASRVAGLLQNRLNEVMNQSATYDAENYALAQACTVDTDGVVVSMFLSPEHEDMRKILLSYLQ